MAVKHIFRPAPMRAPEDPITSRVQGQRVRPVARVLTTDLPKHEGLRELLPTRAVSSVRSWQGRTI